MTIEGDFLELFNPEVRKRIEKFASFSKETGGDGYGLFQEMLPLVFKGLNNEEAIVILDRLESKKKVDKNG